MGALTAHRRRRRGRAIRFRVAVGGGGIIQARICAFQIPYQVAVFGNLFGAFTDLSR